MAADFITESSPLVRQPYYHGLITAEDTRVRFFLRVRVFHSLTDYVSIFRVRTSLVDGLLPEASEEVRRLHRTVDGAHEGTPARLHPLCSLR